ncbi:MAG: 2OG-Fe(II) oxygenase, partial [Gemmatimonadaceae bacterium]
TAIQGLIPDPYFMGGGYHETGRGGKLGIHADFRVNEQLHLHRRLNVIVYLNEHWDESYGGNLELWTRDMTEKRHEVAPLFNRCVIFNTDANSYHGHPDPMTTPDGVFRRSIALYYYTASKEIYNEVPNTSTIYHARPGDDRGTRREAWNLRVDQHLRQWVPPALLRYVFAVKRRLSR